MNRRRRVEVQIEQREISLFAGSGANLKNGPLPMFGNVSGPCEFAACPTCGSPGMLLLAGAVAQQSLDLTALEHGAKSGAIHLHRSASGHWWVCAQSLHPG
jgi:hypothetical protein